MTPLLKFLTLFCVVFSLLNLTTCQPKEDDMDRQVRTLVNQERAKVGAAPFAFNQILYDMSFKYAEEMLKGNFFAHVGLDGSTIGSRAKAAGYTGWSSLAENLAKGQQSAVSVVKSWMDSAGHRANLLNPKLNEMAVARSSSGFIWAQAFGERKGVQVPAAPPTAPPPAPTPSPTPAPTPRTPAPTPSTPAPTPARTTPAPTPARTTPAPTPARASPAPTPARSTPAPTAAPTPRTLAPTPARSTPGPVTRPTTRPNRPPPSNGLTIFYYQGNNFEQFKVKTFGPPIIKNPTGSQFQIEGVTIPGYGFSVKYIGRFRAEVTGVHYFETVSDDGVRVFVGGVNTIDNWGPHSPTINRSGPLHLTAGAYYQLRIEYFNYVAEATLQLTYQAPGMKDDVPIPLSMLTPDLEAKAR